MFRLSAIAIMPHVDLGGHFGSDIIEKHAFTNFFTTRQDSITHVVTASVFYWSCVTMMSLNTLAEIVMVLLLLVIINMRVYSSSANTKHVSLRYVSFETEYACFKQTQHIRHSDINIATSVVAGSEKRKPSCQRLWYVVHRLFFQIGC